MQDFLLQHEDFDVVVVDEADTCVMDHGIAIDYADSKIVGFWDAFAKRTFLLTATINTDLVDVLKDVFKHDVKEQTYNFTELYNSHAPDSCKQSIEYMIVPDEQSIHAEIRGTIIEKKDKMPIIVFLQNSTQIRKLQAALKDLKLTLFIASNE